MAEEKGKKQNLEHTLRGVLLLSFWLAVLAFVIQLAVNNLVSFLRLSYSMAYDTALYLVFALAALKLTWNLLEDMKPNKRNGEEMNQAFMRGFLVSNALRHGEEKKGNGANAN